MTRRLRIRPDSRHRGCRCWRVDGSEHWLHRTPSALNHLFDRIYYPCLDATRGRPYGLFVHGNQDTGGAVAAVEQITGALGWRAAAAPLTVMGAPERADLDACTELGGTVAAVLAEDL